MSSREVVLVNKSNLASTAHHVGASNFDEVRVEIRVIFPPDINLWEAENLIELASVEAKSDTRRRLDYLYGLSRKSHGL